VKTASSPAWRTAAGLCALAVVYMAAGWPLMKKLGIEADEAMIGNGIYERAAPWYSWHWAGNEIPVMLITYLGALKTWIYNGIFLIWAPSAVSLRLPTMLLGVGTLVLFFVLLDRALGRRAAWVGTALLATDPSFILTEPVDWGFVAFQQAFKVGALVLLLAFHRKPEPQRLGAAFFLFGLAMWDKAVFSWVLGGIAVGGALVFWKEVRPRLSARNAMIAAAGFIAGSFPFLVYNAVRRLETFTASARASAEGAMSKLYLLKRTLDGSAAFGFVTAPDTGPNPGTPHGLVQQAGFWLNDRFGAPTTTWTAAALVAAILGLPLVWRTSARRPVQFALVVMAVTWIQMFLTAGAGGALHHVILLWPFQFLVIAAVMVEAARYLGKYAPHGIAAITALLAVSNLAVANHYFVALVRNGPSVRWTDAFPRLNAWLYGAHAKRIVTADWGILETLNLVSEGELPVEDASAALHAGDAGPIAEKLAAPGVLWVTHGNGYEIWQGVNAALDRLASGLGYSKERLQTIHDRNGRPIFDIFRFRRGAN
jgi:hypothetical protein